MATYDLGSGMKRIDVSANNAKNSLPIGTVLQLNGYSCPRYVVVKNEGIDQNYGYGARYLTVSLEDGKFSKSDAYGMMHISEKTSNRIQMYYTDDVVSPDECLRLYEKASALQKLEEQIKEDSAKRISALVEKGKKIAAEKGIDAFSALIVAEYEQDDCDLHTDYFNTKTTQMIILSTSKHARDLFPEMRKAAGKFEKTAHLGTGKGDFTAYVSIGADFKSNGSYYSAGCQSHWHNELIRKFKTRAEAEAYINSQPTPGAVSFDGVLVPFLWEISENNIEHREKYSMGVGYYLKASSRYSSGWTVSKRRKYGNTWGDDIYISLAQICLL